MYSFSILVLEREWIDIETQRSHDHKCYELSKAITRWLRHDQSVPRGSDGAIHHSDIIDECRKEFDGASQWLLEDWISTLAKGGAKKRIQYCVNPNSSNQFLYFRATHGHSGDNAVDLAVQDNVHLPKGFTECIYHVGNKNELNSTIRNGLIPGGTRFKRGRAVCFTTGNPMEDVYGMGETPCDLTKPRIAPYKNTWKRFQNTLCSCILKLAQENHTHEESFIQDLSLPQKINKFSKESQDVIADLNNTEIFELCEHSSEQQRLDCNILWEIGIIYCSCGRNVKSTRSPTEFDENNRDVTSFFGYVIKKTAVVE